VRLDDVTGESTLSKQIGFDAIAFVPNKVYLPLIMKSIPPPPPVKEFTGIHLGRRDAPNPPNPEGDWTTAMLQPIDGQKDGVYPRAVVVLSDQVWHLNRSPNGYCEVAGAIPRDDRSKVYDYLTRAAQNGVMILIRIYPTPGNFQDWNGVGSHTLIATTTPAGGNYCGTNPNYFRAFDDVVNEMDAIQAINHINGWPDNSTYFIPANEPNQEWYHGLPNPTVPAVYEAGAWQAMDSYFSALIAYARQDHPQVRILTPPMGPEQYAEGIDWMNPNGPCNRQSINGQTGYEIMQNTYTPRANGYYGYSWHNYFIQGREPYDSCENGGFHISYYFPSAMQQAIMAQGYPAFIDETDLCSVIPVFGGCYNSNSIHWKDDNPVATASSLNYFFQAENQATNAIPILWLLNNYDATPEYEWHEAFDDGHNRFYNWFNTWWSTAQ
jgi:hypothetical protein